MKLPDFGQSRVRSVGLVSADECRSDVIVTAVLIYSESGIFASVNHYYHE
jgi:hypothetical protein